MNKLLLIFLVCLSASCGLPNHVHGKYAKFDIARYNSLQVNGIAHINLKRGGYTDQSKMPDGGYAETMVSMAPNQRGISFYKEFYSTGELKHWGFIFYGFYIHTHKTYGKDGYAIKEKEINYEAPYKYSLGQLDAKIRREYGIIIFKDNIQISRTDKTNPPVYKLLLPVYPDTANVRRAVVINANNGKTISDVVLNN